MLWIYVNYIITIIDYLLDYKKFENKFLKKLGQSLTNNNNNYY